MGCGAGSQLACIVRVTAFLGCCFAGLDKRCKARHVHEDLQQLVAGSAASIMTLQHAAVAEVYFAWHPEPRQRRPWSSAASQLNDEARQHLQTLGGCSVR